MGSKLYVFVEGKDDERLIKVILKKCYPKYTPKFFRYINPDSRLVKEIVGRLISDNDLYVMFADMDYWQSITERKQHRSNEFGVEEEKIIVVKASIESWYAAGAKPSKFNRQANRTEEINKKKFDQLIGRRAYHTKVMEEISEDFDTSLAISNNKSFKYFYRELKRLLGETVLRV